MKDCGMCHGTGSIYAGYLMTWAGPANRYDVCEACGGSGQETQEVTSIDWAEFEAMQQAQEQVDFLEACAGLDKWFREQGRAA